MPAGKNPEKKENTKDKRPLSDGFFNAINTEKVISSAQQIVSSAVNVLEEEIAAGILAAKKMEKKLIDVDDLRDNPDDLMNRIRRDSHEAIDLFLDAFSAISSQMGGMLNSLKKETENEKKPGTPPVSFTKAAVTLVEAEKPLKPGDSTVLYLSVHDDGTGKPAKISLQKSDLIGPFGQHISSRAIQVKPASLTMKPGEQLEIALHIKLPKNCLPGKYHALLTDISDPDIKVVAGVNVVS